MSENFDIKLFPVSLKEQDPSDIEIIPLAEAATANAAAAVAKTKTNTKAIKVIKGDSETLFSFLSNTEPISIAHAVAVDLAMGKGIAVEFKKRFGSVEELKAENPVIGDVLFLETEGAHQIGYLITKQRSSGKPTLEDFDRTVKNYYDELKKSGINKAYLPRIGTGLDGLSIEHVVNLLTEQQNSSGIETTLVLLDDDTEYDNIMKLIGTGSTRRFTIKKPTGASASASASARAHEAYEDEAHQITMLGGESSLNIEDLTCNKAHMTYRTKDGIDWVLPHNRKFATFINTHFKKYTLPLGKFTISCGQKVISKPFPYQEFLRDYLKYGTPNRGIATLHGLGSGKTRTTIMISETFRKAGLKTLFFGPASLKNNFIEELLKWGEPGENGTKLPADFDKKSSTDQAKIIEQKRKIIDKGYIFVSSNASNVLVQLARHGIGYPTSDPGTAKENSNAVKRFIKIEKDKHGRTLTLYYPRHMFIILEEAHNANQTFSNPKAKALGDVYHIFKNAIDCKFDALTATPIINNPFEICTLFNLLRGKLSDGRELLPETEAEFNKIYVDEGKDIIKNEERLARTVSGLVSYYKGITDDREIFPDLDEKEDILVQMSEYQKKIYQEFEEEEVNLESRQKRGVKKKLASAPGVKSEQVVVGFKQQQMEPKSSYRFKTRAASNYVWPEDVPKPLTDPIWIDHFDFKGILSEIPDPVELFKAGHYNELKVIAQILEIHISQKDKPADILKKIREFKNVIVDAEFESHTDIGEKLCDPANDNEFKKQILSRKILLNFGGILALKVIPSYDSKGQIVAEKLKYVAKSKKEKKKQSSMLPHEIDHVLTESDKDKFFYATAEKPIRLVKALNKISNDPEKYLSDDALAVYSPKMLALYNNLLSGDGALKLVKGPSIDPKITENTLEKVAEIIANKDPRPEDDEAIVQEAEDDAEKEMYEQSGGGDDDEEISNYSNYSNSSNDSNSSDSSDMKLSSEQMGGGFPNTDKVYWIKDNDDNQFAPTYKDRPFGYNGQTYATIIHAYQAQKSTNPEYISKLVGEEPEIPADKVIEFGTPVVMKANGYSINSDWDESKNYDLMSKIVTEFYIENEEIYANLSDTHPKHIVYYKDNSNKDSFWSMNTHYNGHNNFGKILMEMRDIFSETDPSETNKLPTSAKKILDNPAALKQQAEQALLYRSEQELTKENMHIEGGPALVYSIFSHGEGVGIFKRILDARGYELFAPSKYKFENIEHIDYKPRYTIISGDVDMGTRSQIMKFFNHPRNKHGQLIRTILVTSAGSEGISLFYIRQVHILEPYWHNVRIRQVIGRARRLCSHQYLPDEQRIVHVYKYFAVTKILEGVATEESTDLHLKFIAKRKDNIINSVMNVLKGAAVDCVLNAAQNNPDNLYKCFSFPIGDDENALAYVSSSVKDVEVKESKKTSVPMIRFMSGTKDLGSYKIDNKNNPIEFKEGRIKDSAPKDFNSFKGKTMRLVPLYHSTQVLSDIFTLIGYLTKTSTGGNVVISAKFITLD